MKASLIVLSIATSTAVAQTTSWALFQGSSCDLDIPSFTAANANLPTSGQVAYTDGQLVMTLEPPADTSNVNNTGISVIGTTPLSLLYGTVEATIQQANIGGVVTYLTLINQVSRDEIDFEWIGNENTQVWTNFFYRGRRERNPVTLDEIWSEQITMNSDNTIASHDYKIEWTPIAITWSIDGTVVRVQNKSGTYEAAGTGDGLPYDHYHYPDTPLTVNVGIWNDQDTVWSNGPVNWADYPQGVTAKISSLKVSCYTGTIPTYTDPIIVPSGTAAYLTAAETIAPPTGNSSSSSGSSGSSGSSSSGSTSPTGSSTNITALPGKSGSKDFETLPLLAAIVGIAVFL
ncbi:hypothetical protein HK100_005436 [Physocladia obscura]|uniref:GH16 domain-containing protein n=1 Tax=Physocladia obscura TaxID=109957 RepID=A0AAD5STR5_9FUNG|nr:hypothetical protein HK100_005436 [Physocladia obscura]